MTNTSAGERDQLCILGAINSWETCSRGVVWVQLLCSVCAPAYVPMLVCAARGRGGESGGHYHHSALLTIRRHLAAWDNHRRVREVTTSTVQRQTKLQTLAVDRGDGSPEDSTYTQMPSEWEKKIAAWITRSSSKCVCVAGVKLLLVVSGSLSAGLLCFAYTSWQLG